MSCFSCAVLEVTEAPAQRQYASLTLRPGCAVRSCQSIPVELCHIILTASLPGELLLIWSCLTCTQCKESTTRPVTSHDVGTLCEHSVPSGKVRPEREGHLSAWHLIMIPAPLPQGSSSYKSARWPCWCPSPVKAQVHDGRHISGFAGCCPFK